MRMTTKVQYALVALANIKHRNDAGNMNPVRIDEIVKDEELSQHYLEQLFRKLRVAGIVKSIRGPGGGYKLREESISYKQVLEAVGEGMDLKYALEGKSPVSKGVINGLGLIQTNLTKELESFTI